ncbi:MFS transporter [Ideonella sp. DXS29W]|uniref:MFS transporter n=1 Tax=Ideonella lacteola TaxID=2984193 RepID=A0ABU9BME5_9BURK
MSTASSPSHGHEGGQFALLGQRRFAPFFWTQFLGAANDNIFKFAFTVLVTYQMHVSWMEPKMAGLVIGAVFIAPFLLFSATSGQLADKYDKATLTRLVKNLELVIMVLGAIGLFTSAIPLLLGCIFLLGLHSTVFGPVKYAYLPQHLAEHELTGGNGMIEMGTFVAILLGNLAGGVLIALPADHWLPGTHAVAVASVVLAIVGRVVAQAVPATPSTAPGLKVNWNPFSETWRNLKLAHEGLAVFRSLLGISWMWFFGAAFLSQFPSFAKDVLHGNEQVASLLLMVFSIGIATGSLLCETLSRRHVEIGLVPLGAIGMSVFAADLYFASRGLGGDATTGTMTVAAFLAQSAHWRVLADLFALSLSAGLYSVPMYALIQLRSPPSHRARIIAANNILNALFMIASSLIVGALLSAGFSIPEVFGLIALANLIVGAYIFLVVPEYLLRFLAWMLSRFIYRLRLVDTEHIPSSGPAVIVCNHVSFVDAVLLMAASPRPIRFVMDHRIFKVPVLGWLFKLAKAIPIAPRGEDPAAYEAAFEAADAVLADDEIIGIFPEGGITHDGVLQPFKGGVMKIIERRPVPVIPVALVNLWGSFFSRAEGGRAMVKPFRRGLFSRVTVVAAPPVAPQQVTPDGLRDTVQGLLIAHGEPVLRPLAA